MITPISFVTHSCQSVHIASIITQYVNVFTVASNPTIVDESLIKPVDSVFVEVGAFR